MTTKGGAAMRHETGSPVLLAFCLLLALAMVILAGISFGVSELPVARALHLLFTPDGSPDSALVWDVRLPRAMLAMLVGANLAVAGVLIQTLTRNSLASPQTFGINAGASLVIVISLIAMPGLSAGGTVWPAFIGAAAVGLAMWALSVSGAMNEMKLALAGISIQLVLAALVQAILDCQQCRAGYRLLARRLHQWRAMEQGLDHTALHASRRGDRPDRRSSFRGAGAR